MSVIQSQCQRLYDYFQGMSWNHALYWLLLGYVLTYLLALAVAQGLYQLQKNRPVEKTVYVAWAIGFLLHVVLWIWASNALSDAWYYVLTVDGFEESDLSRIQAQHTGIGTFHVIGENKVGLHYVPTGIPMLRAFLRLLPYVFIFMFDVFWIIKLFMAGRTTTGPVRRPART